MSLVGDTVQWLRDKVDDGQAAHEEHHRRAAELAERAAAAVLGEEQQGTGDLDRSGERYPQRLARDAEYDPTPGDDFDNIVQALVDRVKPTEDEMVTVTAVLEPFIEAYLTALPDEAGRNLRRAMAIGAFAMLLEGVTGARPVVGGQVRGVQIFPGGGGGSASAGRGGPSSSGGAAAGAGTRARGGQPTESENRDRADAGFEVRGGASPSASSDLTDGHGHQIP